jgi:hypothetical protein
MRNFTFVLGLVAASCCADSLLADAPSLQSILTNVNGSVSTDYTGYNTGSFNTTTGVGTLTYTFNPGAGSYFFDVFFDHELGVPFYNEYGTVLGAPAAGQSYEIGDSYASNIYNDVLAGGILPNLNTLPGTLSDYSGSCIGANCNGDFAAALGFSFVLGAGEQEVITLSISMTDPGSGLRLEGTHPVDAANTSAVNLFISGSAVAQPINTNPVPEPFSLLLLGTLVAVLMVSFRRRLAPGVN